GSHGSYSSSPGVSAAAADGAAPACATSTPAVESSSTAESRYSAATRMGDSVSRTTAALVAAASRCCWGLPLITLAQPPKTMARAATTTACRERDKGSLLGTAGSPE